MNQFGILFAEKALIDIELGAAYYNAQKNNLGKEFAEQVYLTISSLKTNPFISAIRYSAIRCAVVKRFPFVIHYSIDETNKLISILAIYNTHQKPLW
jgi:hypothetical protein